MQLATRLVLGSALVLVLAAAPPAGALVDTLFDVLDGSGLGVGVPEPVPGATPEGQCAPIHLWLYAGGWGTNLVEAIPAALDIGPATVCGREAHSYDKLTFRGYGCARPTVWLVPPTLPGEELCGGGDWTLRGHVSYREDPYWGFSYSYADAAYGTVEPMPCPVGLLCG